MSEYEDQMALLNYMMSQGINPFSMTDQDVGLYNWSNLPEDSDEWGTMEHQNDRLTMVNKANDYLSDPAMIAQLGATAGGYSPQDFLPTTIYEPVKVKGLSNLQRLSRSADPVSKFMAQALLDGHTARSAAILLQTSMGDPETAQEMMPYLPKAQQANLAGGIQVGMPDFDAVAQMAQGWEDATLNDDDWDGQTFDPKTGAPARSYEEESEAARYFRETGLPNPYERHNPDMLATSNQLNKERRAAETYANENEQTRKQREEYRQTRQQLGEGDSVVNQLRRGVLSGYDLFSAANQLGEENRARDADRFSYLNESLTGGEDGGGWGSLTDRSRASLLGSLQEGDDGPLATTSSTASRGQQRENLQTILDRYRKVRGSNQRDRQMELNQARNSMRAQQRQGFEAWKANQEAGFEQNRRDRMVEAMWQAGLSPFSDVMRARQANTYGY